MKWNRFTVKTKTEAEDIVISTLAEVGIEGVEIQDKQPLTEEDKAQMFVDIMPEGPADDGIAYLNFYLEEDADKEAILKDVREALDDLKNFMDIGEATIEESQTEDKDWINNWKQYFHQFYVDDILIVPSWEEVKAEDKDKMILHIDPGTAFGTGMHETTQLVIRQLKKYVTPDTEMLDVGTGSGILGIVALKLGAKHVLGTDLDPCAVPAVAENKEANQIVDETFDMVIGNIIDDKAVQDAVGYEKYDIVAANILADVLIPLTPVICHQMKPGALYITSGILDVKEDVVVKAVKDAGPNACPPIVVGVGIGGDFEKAAILAKKALTRNTTEGSSLPHIRQMEQELLQTINQLGIGPGGLGGSTTALAVNIETYPTHIAGLPVAVNMCCHVNRHVKRVL